MKILYIFCLFSAIILGGAGFVSYGVDFEGSAAFDGFSEADLVGFSGVSMAGLSDVDSGVSDLQLRLSNILSSTEFDGASVSILAVTATGDTLLCADASRQCIPASNLKLVTTGLALHALGSDYNFATSIGYDGFIEDGILHGDLYIIGGGDPTLGSDNPLAEPLDSLFSQWANFVRNAGISGVDGYVIGDGRVFPGMMEEGTWQLDDVGTYYGTGVCGLNFYENRLDFRVSAGAKAGSPLNIEPIYPVMPWMTYSYACTTGAADTGNTLYYYTSDFAPFGEMRGTFAVNRNEKIEQVANKFPEYTVASYFVDFLRSEDIDCTCGPADLGYVFHPFGESGDSRSENSEGSRSGDPFGFGVEGGTTMSADNKNSVGNKGGSSIYGKFIAPPVEGLTIIGTTFSPTLGKIVEVTNHDSNNMYAETLFRTIGRELGGEGTYGVAGNVEAELLAELGVEDGNIVVLDGSGLSRKDHVSAAFLCGFLKAMTSSPAYPDFLASLPSPGSDGTLKPVMSSVPDATKRRIRMKSGSMDCVRCYSGYILPASATLASSAPATLSATSFTETGSATPSNSTLVPASATAAVSDDTIIFSILVNNFSCPSTAIRRKIESIILLLIE